MTDNVIPEETKQNKCKCGCGKVIPEGKEYSQGHYSKHKKQLKEEAEKKSPQPPHEELADTPPFVLSVLSFELLNDYDRDFDLLAWYETEDGKRIPKIPVAIGIVYNTLTEERLPYYLINSTDGVLIPAPMLPGFIGMFTKYEVEKAEREEEMRKEDEADKPADSIAVTIPEPENQPEESRIIIAPDQNAPEPKKKSTSFLGSIFSGKEKKKTKTTEAQEISQMLAKIQNNAAKSTG